MDGYIAETKNGKIRGYEREGRIEYLGIPFAKPPVGELRFKRAVPMDAWEGILEAREYGPESVQLDEGELKGSEDSLTLNIQRPLEGGNLPVFVWIHGGGYNTGAASVPLYNGKAFVRDGLIFVSFQYRMNVLGFYDFTTYPGCGDFDSNCGISDQIMALTWIHENIAAFGGDPDQVTIAGESAGGASVVNMLAIPAVKGMFRQAVIQSALPNCVCTHQTARENIDLFLEGMGWTEDDLPKLRTEDPYEFQKGNTYVAEKHQYKNPGMFLPGPVIDDLLPVRPIDAIRGGSAAGVKIIIGTNQDEGTMFVHPEKTGFPNSWAMVAEMFEKNGNASALPDIINYYHPSARDRFQEFRAQGEFTQNAVPDVQSHFRTEGGDPFIEFATDYAFQMPALKVAEAQRKYNDVWMYRFEFVSINGEKTGWKASHAFDIPCVFANKDFKFSRFLFEGETEETKNALIEAMHTPWVRFAKTGEPDPENWPKYDGYNSEIRIFDRKTTTKLVRRKELMDVWGELRFYED